MLSIIMKELESLGTQQIKKTYLNHGYKNTCIFAIGISVKDLTDFAYHIGQKVGKVTVDMHGTACKVHNATEYIQKAKNAGRIGFKRKTSRC